MGFCTVFFFATAKTMHTKNFAEKKKGALDGAIW